MKKIFIILNTLLLTACTNYGDIKLDNLKTNNKPFYLEPEILFIQKDNPYLDENAIDVAPKNKKAKKVNVKKRNKK